MASFDILKLQDNKVSWFWEGQEKTISDSLNMPEFIFISSFGFLKNSFLKFFALGFVFVCVSDILQVKPSGIGLVPR